MELCSSCIAEEELSMLLLKWRTKFKLVERNIDSKELGDRGTKKQWYDKAKTQSLRGVERSCVGRKRGRAESCQAQSCCVYVPASCPGNQPRGTLARASRALLALRNSPVQSVRDHFAIPETVWTGTRRAHFGLLVDMNRM